MYWMIKHRLFRIRSKYNLTKESVIMFLSHIDTNNREKYISKIRKSLITTNATTCGVVTQYACSLVAVTNLCFFVTIGYFVFVSIAMQAS